MATNNVPPPKNHKIRRLQYDRLKTGMQSSIRKIFDTVISSKGVLDLQIRYNYFNLYFKGGSQWKVSNISPRSRGMQIVVETKYFDRKHGIDKDFSWLPGPKDPLNDWLKTLSRHQVILNGWFEENDNKERQLQHKLSVNHLLHYNSKWVILDIEYEAWLHGKKKEKKNVNTRRGCKYDLIGVKRSDLMTSKTLPVYVMELKQGNGSITGDSSITSHAEDMQQLIYDKADVRAKNALLDSIRLSFSEKQTLGLLPNVSGNLLGREIELMPAFILEGVDNTPDLEDQKSKADEILSAYHSDIPWLDYDKMINAKMEV